MNTDISLRQAIRREQARQNVVAALQTGAHIAIRDDRAVYQVSDLVDAVGQDRASDLLDDRFSAFHDLLSLAKDMKQLADRMTLSLAAATEYVSGEPASFNSLGVLQSDGPRFDGYCMVFPIRVEQAVAAEVAVLSALAEKVA